MSTLLPPAPPATLSQPGRGRLRWALSRIRAFTSVQEPPATRGEQALYGFAQPILGARVLFSDRQVLLEALQPAALLALGCAFYASISSEAHGQWSVWFRFFYRAFATLAPLPSFFFANHYARLAAYIRFRLGFGSFGPREMSWRVLGGRMLRQALIVAVGIAPVIGLSRAVPAIGGLLENVALAIWGLHWVVADALDDAQVCLPGESVKQSIQRDRDAPPPWFVRWLLQAADHVPVLGAPIRWFARLCDRLALDSRGEIATMEAHRPIALGFSIMTAALLATPVLNLLFRPIIIAGSSHLLAQLEKEELPSGAGIRSSARAQ